MANDNLNLLEWYASHRGQVELLRDPAALFALGLLDQAGPTSRAALQADLGVSPTELDRTIEQLFRTGFVSTSGTMLAATPAGQQFLVEVGLRGPLPPTSLPEERSDQPKPPQDLPESGSRAGSGGSSAPRTPFWLWAVVGILIVAAILLFGALSGFGGGVTTQTATAQLTFTPVPSDTSTPVTRTPSATATPEATSTRTRTPVRVTRTATRPPTRVTRTPSPLPQPTIVFVAKPTQISPGECAVLDWQVVNSRRVQLNGERVPLADSRRVCPEETTTYNLESESFEGEIRTDSLVLTVTPRVFDYVWTINPKNVPSSDPSVIEALTHGIDEPRIVDIVLNGQGSLVNTDPSLDKLQYDPERAQFLLEEAGYGREGIYIAYADDISRKMAEYMVESLAVIKVSAKVIDSPDSLAAIYVRPAQ